MSEPNKVIYIAETDARNARVKFGIKQKDRSRHVYVIGKTGMGKSTLLENMAAQDIRDGNGMCFIDPHGKTAELMLEYIPKERIKDVLYFAPFDMEYPISFNIMEDVGYDKRHLVVSGLMSAFKKIWKDAWSARMEYILSNTLFALLEYPDATLLSVNRMLSDKAFRKKVVENIQDTAVKSFWVDEFANYTERMAAEAVPAIQNKVGQFTSNPLIRNIIGQPKSSFDLREMMDNKKIIIVNLSKGRMGESNAQLLGSLLVTKIYLAAMSRADQGPHEIELLPDFSLFVDEFQSFANESFADILSEARKYKLNLHIAHQYVEQMPEEVRSAVFGNVGTLITFRVGSTDAELFEKEFAPTFTQEDIVNLGLYQFYLRLMIDGVGSKPFSARSLPPLAVPEENNIVAVIDSSRSQFSRSRIEVEELVKQLTNFGKSENAPQQNKGSSDRQGQNNGGDRRGGGERDQNKRNDGNRRNDDYRNNRPNQDFRNEKPIVKDDPKNIVVDLTKKEENSKPQFTDKKPVISKEKEFEIKKQMEEAKKKAIDESTDEEQKDIKEEFISLKSITQKPGQKDMSKENKNALKDALLKVLQQNGANQTVTKIQNENNASKIGNSNANISSVETPKQNLPIEDKGRLVEEIKKHKQEQENPRKLEEDNTKNMIDESQNHNPIMPGEIPEDQLRKLLEVEIE